MSRLLITVLLSALAATISFAGEPGGDLPLAKIDRPVTTPVFDGRGGGDDAASALPIPATPFSDTGSTCGHGDDFDVVCPYGGSTSPDVWYTFAATWDLTLEIDLCGSAYDTKVYVLDQDLETIACNDDAYFDDDPCGEYVSYLWMVPVADGQTVYIVVDGYGGACGTYQLEVATDTIIPCDLTCDGDFIEGEPPLEDGYSDDYNNGCSTPENGENFQHVPVYYGVTMQMCGTSGWYHDPWGLETRDGDWYRLDAWEALTLTIDAEQPVRVLRMEPQDCVMTAAVDDILAGPCDPQGMEVPFGPYGQTWLVVLPATFEPPPGFVGHEFEYTITIEPGPVAVQEMSWGDLKSRYR